MSLAILVMSCDRYAKHTFEMFHHCIEKYWKGHPKVYCCTETIDNPYYETLKIDYPVSEWTKRLNGALKQIDTDIVLVCPDDTFFRKKVNYGAIKKLCSYIDNKLISINLEPPFDCYQVNELLCVRNANGKWLTSMMPTLWSRKKLIELTDNVSLNPRETERIGKGTNYNYGIIATNNTDIDFGKVLGIYPYAITEGKWAKEMVDFAKNEGIDIDFNELGFFIRKGQ